MNYFQRPEDMVTVGAEVGVEHFFTGHIVASAPRKNQAHNPAWTVPVLRAGAVVYYSPAELTFWV